MKNEKLVEIKNNFSTLQVLEKRMERLIKSIYEAEAEVQSLLAKFEAEALDVEKLKEDSFSTTLLRLFGKYDSKLDKEAEEMLSAKMAYDKSVERVKELKQERENLGSRISALRNDKRLYEDEIKRREEGIISSTDSKVSVKYMELEKERKMLMQQLVETDEALRVAIEAINIGKRAVQYLESAEKWATYDVWFKSGIISHMVKYDHIDNAESEFNRLDSQLKNLKKELKDVRMLDTPEISTISSSQRAVDFWFDNIFTDLNVRGKIRNDIEQLGSLQSSIYKIISRLKSNKTNINRKLKSIEEQKNNLLINV